MRFSCRPVDASFFDTAPMRFKNVVELGAPPASVFPFFRTEHPGLNGFVPSKR
jgi:hypothetical protein